MPLPGAANSRRKAASRVQARGPLIRNSPADTVDLSPGNSFFRLSPGMGDAAVKSWEAPQKTRQPVRSGSPRENVT